MNITSVRVEQGYMVFMYMRFSTFPNAAVFRSNVCLLDIKTWLTTPDSSTKMDLGKPVTNLANVFYATTV